MHGLVDSFKKELGGCFEITDGGELHWLLGFINEIVSEGGVKNTVFTGF